MKQNKKIVVIGGGTGTYSILSGLKNYPADITAVVSMADSGGSAKKERDAWGLLPSSDIRKSLLALADVSTSDSLLLRKLFQYRFSEGEGFVGMTFGNLFLVTLTKIMNSQSKAIEKASEFLRIRGKVLPVTMDKIDLVASYADGTKVVGEHFIDQPAHNGKIAITRLYTNPKALLNPEVGKAISESDLIIIGPGGFYTTIIANLVINGMGEALSKSQAKIIYIQNLMTEIGQTYKFTASKFINILNQYLPSKNLDYVFINNAPIPPNILKRYQKVDAEPIMNDFAKTTSFKVIAADLLSPKLVKKETGDLLNRSLIRHDSSKIAKLCMKIIDLV
ncbi:YvcK family protein [Candidatus Gottesmanbacteria bacterium]|nr:YvcK family protein [Candidatus Gottesmanbacteria bacterium]